jgi:hypothetical protein
LATGGFSLWRRKRHSNLFETRRDCPIPPEGVCTVYFDVTDDRDYDLYRQPDSSSDIVATVPEGVYVPVEARGSYDALRIRLDDGRTGWLIEPDQLLHLNHALNGPCEDLPVEQQSVPQG